MDGSATIPARGAEARLEPTTTATSLQANAAAVWRRQRLGQLFVDSLPTHGQDPIGKPRLRGTIYIQQQQ